MVCKSKVRSSLFVCIVQELISHYYGLVISCIYIMNRLETTSMIVDAVYQY